MNNRKSFFYAKAFYFFYYGAWACLQPYLALYYQELGFVGSQIGMLASISPLVSLFGAPVWGGIADAFQRHRQVLLAAIAGTTIAVFGLMQVHSFWILLPIISAYAFFSAPVIPLVDNTVLDMLGEHRDRYGSQRLWGAIGWGLAGPTSGWINGQFGISTIFYGYIFMAIFALFSASRLPIHPPQHSSPFRQGVRQLLSDRRWYIFLFVAFLGGSGLSVISNYLFLYLRELNASATIMGLTLTMATISEIPVLFFSGFMLRRLGTRGLLTLSLAAYVVRAFAYSIAAEPWQAMLIQLFHGLTFSAMWVAGISFANQIAPKGLGATAQSLFSSTFMGLGGISGALFGGMILERFGASAMYAWFAGLVFLGLVIFLAAGKSLVVTESEQAAF